MARPGFRSVVVVTGLPSLYARRLIEQIADAEPDSFIYGLVPEADAAYVSERIDEEMSAHRGRIELLTGQAPAMDLGLSGIEFRMLAREIDCIHHAWCESRDDVTRKEADANITAAAEVLELSRASSSLDRLVMHSTALVSGDRKGAVFEHELDRGQGFRSATRQARMKAEQIIAKAMPDLPITIVRPTTIVGDSQTGEIDRLDGVYLLAMLILSARADIAVPLPGPGDTPLNVVPIDYVIRASHALGLSKAAASKTFHLADPHPLSAKRVFELIAKAAGKKPARAQIPSNVARAVLRAPGIEHFLRSPRAFVEQLLTPVHYDTSNTDAALRDTPIQCPPFESYVEHLVNVVQEHLRLRLQKDKPVEGPDSFRDHEDPLS